MTRLGIDLTRAEIVEALAERDGYRCTFPGCVRPLNDPKDIDTLDHIYPQVLAKAAGWTRAQIDDLDNLQLMHKSCNALKGHQLPDEDGRFHVNVREPKVVKLPRPEFCEMCFSGRLLMIGEECPDCGIGPQPARWPGSLQRKPKECDHSTYHCWVCVIDQPELRVPATQRLITGP
jgi:hypothetical protein